VTGKLGGAAAGLRMLEAGRPAGDPVERRWIRSQLDPKPRLEAARVLAQAGVRVAGDISDGLFREVEKIAAAASLGALIDTSEVPLAQGLAERFGDQAWRLGVEESEDFELVCAGPAAVIHRAAAALRSSTGLRLTVVGSLRREPGIKLMRGGRSVRVRHPGYAHFR
jgi:thiamine monophosphate kinase